MNILLAKLRIQKKTSPKIGPLKALSLCQIPGRTFFADKESILKSFAGLFFATSFQPFWRGIERLQVFLWPFGKTAHHFFASITVKPPPKKIRWKLHTCALFVVGSAMAPRLAFKVKHVLSQKWHYTLSSTYIRLI